jgi:hypothetical protein
MSAEVDRTEHWPKNQWHPAYDSIKEWLDGEAPETIPVEKSAKAKNRPRFRILRRRR